MSSMPQTPTSHTQSATNRDADLGATSTAITAAAAAQQYELLLHSLTHEHTRDNLGRHALLLEKWTRDYATGFYLRDIPFIVQVLEVLLDRLDIDYTKFRHILTQVLEIVSKPLFESKANERFRSGARKSIASLYRMIVRFWQIPEDLKLGLEICKCFRCIANQGVDPTILKVDIVKWEYDGNKMQITERTYILNILRGCGVLDSIINKFTVVLDEFLAERTIFDGTIAKDSTKKNASGYADNAVEKDLVEAEGPSSPSNNTIVKSSGEASNLAKYTEYVQSMLDLCVELACDDPKCAAYMCHAGIVDILVVVLKDAAKGGPRHKRIPQSIDLMWTVLEAYVTQCKTGKDGVSTIEDDYTLDGEEAFYITYDLSARIMNFEETVQTLKDVLQLLLLDGYRLVDKECRNEIIIVLSLVLEFRRAFPCFILSDLLTTVVSYSCAGEMGIKSWAFFSSPMAKFRNFVSSFDIDMQFKRELWMLVSELMMTDDPDVLACIASSPLLSALLLYLEQDSIEKMTVSAHGSVHNNGGSVLDQASFSVMKQEPSVSIDSMDSAMGHLFPASVTKQQSILGRNSNNQELDHNATASQVNSDMQNDDKNKEEPNIAFLNTLSKSQLKEFQTLAMKVLATIATKIIGEFNRINGPRRILSIISHYCQSNDTIHKEIVHFGLLLINRCLLCSNFVRKIMESDNAISIFLYLFANSSEEPTRALAVRLISILCRGGNLICQDQVRKQNGIRLCIEFISKFASPKKAIVGAKAGVKFAINPITEPEDPTTDISGDANVFIVATLDCIRESVIGNKKAELKFAKLEGIDAILNLLEVSSFLLRVQVLRLISDLIDNRKTQTFLHSWRSAKTMRSAAQLVAHCWLDEEARLDSRRENGVINNLWDPLGRQSWPTASGEQHSQFSISTGSIQECRSVAVSKLASAILAARTEVHSIVPTEMKTNIMEKDTRGIVASILDKIGMFEDPATEGSQETKVNSASPQELAENSLKFDSYDEGGMDNNEKSRHENDSRVMLSTSLTGDLGLNASDKQVVAIAKRYTLLKEGEWWSSILEDCQVEALVPIEADMKMIDSRTDHIFNATMAVQMEQMRLDDHALFEKQKQENEYNDQIVAQKNLQIKAEWLKRNGKSKMK